ncbi:MAG: ATP synthase F0 subunit C [Chloroflexi bacterium]|nr:ATP synthase F0 subunit C [Chloroflexota bacterium]
MHDLAASVVADVLAQTTASAGITGQLKQLGAGLAIGLGAIGPGIGIGIAVRGALEAIGRNPETEGAVRNTMILGAALSEAVAIYALLIALLLIFV